MHRCRRLGIHLEAGRRGSAGLDDARMVAPGLTTSTAIAPEVGASSRDAGPLPAPPRATILIVDDMETNRYALTQVLADLEQNIVEASSGEDALRFLLREECAV